MLGHMLRSSRLGFRFAMYPRGGVFTLRALAQQDDGVGGSFRLGFRFAMFPRGGVFTFRVLAQQNDGF